MYRYLFGFLCVLCVISSALASDPLDVQTTVRYEIVVELWTGKSLEIVKLLGLETAAIGRNTYGVSPDIFYRLDSAGIKAELLGGASKITAKSVEQFLSPGQIDLDSGDVFFDIPDGASSPSYYTMTASGAPDWATVTNVEFSTLIESGYGITCYDYVLALFHGTQGEDYVFWLNFGSWDEEGTDDNFDSDPENDNDIDIQNSSTGTFNGEIANGDWGLSCHDMIYGDAGWMRYLQITIYWEAGDPPDPDIRVVPTQLDFVIGPGEGGTAAPLVLNNTADTNKREAGEKAAIQKKLSFNPKSDYVQGKIFVRFKSEVDAGPVRIAGNVVTTNNVGINRLLKSNSASSIKKVRSNRPESKIFSIAIDPKKPIERILDEFNKNPDVIYAEPVYRRKISATPTDSSFSEQWAYQKIQAEDGWDIETGDSNIIIAVIDTGVDWDHPDLADNIWINAGEIAGNGLDDDANGYIDDVRGWDTYGDGTTGDNDPMDTHGHGTHVAGIAGGVTNNSHSLSYNIAGTAWNCRIMSIRAGEETFEDDELFEAIDYAVDNGADIINLSMGGPDSSQTFETVCNDAVNAGVVLVAAAGNEDGLITSYPAAFDSVIGVAATDSNDVKADYSNYGNWVDISAPGSYILSAVWDDDYDFWDGTSMSCPIVAGAAGLVLSHDSSLTVEEVTQILVDNADGIDHLNPGLEGKLGSGRLNLYESLNAVVTAGWPRDDFTIYNDGTGNLDVTTITKKYGKSWLYSISPSSVIVPESSSREIRITVNPEGLPEGFSDTETLQIYSNDADEPVVEILVTITIGQVEFAITNIEFLTALDAVRITFNSEEDDIYNIYYSNDLMDPSMTWSLAAAGITGDVGTTKWTDTGVMTGGPPSTAAHRSYKVEDVYGE